MRLGAGIRPRGPGKVAIIWSSGGHGVCVRAVRAVQQKNTRDARMSPSIRGYKGITRLQSRATEGVRAKEGKPSPLQKIIQK